MAGKTYSNEVSILFVFDLYLFVCVLTNKYDSVHLNLSQ
jgi:hypothetical protein